MWGGPGVPSGAPGVPKPPGGGGGGGAGMSSPPFRGLSRRGRPGAGSGSGLGSDPVPRIPKEPRQFPPRRFPAGLGEEQMGLIPVFPAFPRVLGARGGPRSAASPGLGPGPAPVPVPRNLLLPWKGETAPGVPPAVFSKRGKGIIGVHSRFSGFSGSLWCGALGWDEESSPSLEGKRS